MDKKLQFSLRKNKNIKKLTSFDELNKIFGNKDKSKDNKVIIGDERGKKAMELAIHNDKEIKGRFTDYDKRIRGLESWRWWLMGGISIIYFIIIIFFQMLSKYS